MKLTFFKQILILTAFFSLCSFSQARAENTSSSDAWSKANTAYRTAASWAEENNQDTLPELEKLRRRMGDFLNQGLEDFQRKGYLNQNLPRADILEKDGVFYILADLPGMKKDQINIEVKGQEILISGDRKVEEAFKVSNLIKIERQYGNFERIYTIPEAFIADQISAKYENGVLQVKIPKKKIEETVQPKTISVT